tara:strand:+ start:104188 stop:105633 length:1446 start_codon:yes stop_codon:yes gene_type:complete
LSSEESVNVSDYRRDYTMNLLTLQFRDPEIEDKFSAANFVRQIDITRLSIVGGGILFGLFSILDFYIIPDIAMEAWVIRFGLACPGMLIVAALTYSPWFTHKSAGWLSASMLLPGAAVLYMTAHAAQPGAALYYGGIVVVLCYSNCLWRLSYIYSGSISLILLIAYEYVAYFVNPVPFDVFLSNSTFLVSAGLISVFLNLIQEYQLRCSFVDNEQLRIERTRSERLLSRSEAANRAKNDFLAIMSHELRTPLNAIIGFSEIIANQMFGPVGQEKYADYAGDIRSSGTHLLSIINDILDISKAEAGKLSLEEEPIDPVEELNRSMHMFRQRASEIGVELSFRVRDDIPWIIADPRLFNQVAINLTSNALKFTPEGGRVWIEIGLDAKGNFAMSVKDTGIGIKGKDIQRIFEPFVQVENAMSRTHQGTGLGLPLVRKIMGLHGGSVELESIVGEGTIATATFPKNRFVAPEAAGDIKWNVRAS